MTYVPLSQARSNLGLKTSTPSSNTGYVPLDQARQQLQTASIAKPTVVSKPTAQPKQDIGQELFSSAKREIQTGIEKIKGIAISFITPKKIISPVPKEQIVGKQPNIQATPFKEPIFLRPNQKKLTQPQLSELNPTPISQPSATLLKPLDKGITLEDVAKFILAGAADSYKQAGVLLGYKMSDKTQLSAEEAFKMSRRLVDRAKTEKDLAQKKRLLDLSRQIDSDVGKNQREFIDFVKQEAGPPLTPAQAAIKTAAGVGQIIAPFGKLWKTTFFLGGLSGGLDSISRANTTQEAIENLPQGVAIGAVAAVGFKGLGVVGKKILSNLKAGENTPQEVIGAVIKSGQEKTPEGKALVKTALEAQKQGQNIMIEAPKAKQIEAPKKRAIVEGEGFTMTEKANTVSCCNHHLMLCVSRKSKCIRWDVTQSVWVQSPCRHSKPLQRN